MASLLPFFVEFSKSMGVAPEADKMPIQITVDNPKTMEALDDTLACYQVANGSTAIFYPF
jgi:hypothetical protein